MHLLSSLACSLLACFVVLPNAYSSPIISVGSSAANTGAVVDIPIFIQGAQDLYAYQIEIAFDSTLVSAVSVLQGGILDDSGLTFFVPGTIDNNSGTISFTAETLSGAGPGVAGDGTLFTLHLMALKAGTASLSISSAVLLDSNLNDTLFAAQPGSLEISGAATGVPEPRSLTLATLALALLAICARRKEFLLWLRRAAIAALMTVSLFGQDRPYVKPNVQAGASPSAHFGSSPFEPPVPTDTDFIVDRGAGLDTGCTFRSGGPLVFNIKIDRVVGDVGGDGTLTDAATLVANKVVSKFVNLRMPAYDVDYDAVLAPPDQPERDRVLVNGKDIGASGSVAYLTGANNVWKLNEYQIPVELVRFGKRNPGGPPTPGDNQISILIDQANIPIGNEDWCTAIDWAEMEFSALAPVIMIHGNNSNGAFWTDFDFVRPFIDQKIPYDNSISMPTENIAAHAVRLATLVPNLAAEFGAKHVHLVAHSKGGLDSRDLLARLLPPNFGVYSLTTLATPHHGSVGADYSIDSVTANAFFSDNTTRTLLAKQKPPDLGTPNLRVSYLAVFNAANLPLLPTSLTVDGITDPVAYRSFSDDANLDSSVSIFGNPTIQWNETRGTGQPSSGVLSNNTVWATALEAVYRLLGNVASTTLAPRSILGKTVFVVRETPTPAFQLNDFLVTVASARVAGFTEIASLKDNHATIANPATGILTLNSIRAIQPVK